MITQSVLHFTSFSFKKSIIICWAPVWKDTQCVYHIKSLSIVLLSNVVPETLQSSVLFIEMLVGSGTCALPCGHCVLQQKAEPWCPLLCLCNALQLVVEGVHHLPARDHLQVLLDELEELTEALKRRPVSVLQQPVDAAVHCVLSQNLWQEQLPNKPDGVEGARGGCGVVSLFSQPIDHPHVPHWLQARHPLLRNVLPHKVLPELCLAVFDQQRPEGDAGWRVGQRSDFHLKRRKPSWNINTNATHILRD